MGYQTLMFVQMICNQGPVSWRGAEVTFIWLKNEAYDWYLLLITALALYAAQFSYEYRYATSAYFCHLYTFYYIRRNL